MNVVAATPMGEIGPLPTFELPSLQVDSNLLLIGVGVLALAFFLRGASDRVGRYTRRRRSRKKEARALRARLKELRA